MLKRKATSPLMSLRASISPGSVDVEKRTAEVQWSAGSAVLRWNWDIGYYWEKLSMKPEHVRMERMNKGAVNVLDSHDQRSMRSVIGKILDGRLEGGVGKSLMKFSKKALAEEIFQDVKEEIGDTNSIGYLVYRLELVEKPTEGYPTYLATDWEPMEVSFVPVPADADAKTTAERSAAERSEYTTNCEIIENINPNEETGMKTQAEIEAEKKAQQEREAQIRKQAADEAAEIENKRCVAINEICTRTGMSADFAKRMVAEKKTVDQVNSEIIEEMTKRQPSPTKTQVVVGEDVGFEAAKRGVENAILFKSGATKELSAEGRDFAGDSLLRMFEELERSKGRNVRGLAPMKMAARALHSDSDLPGILSNVANKHMLMGYAEVDQSWRELTEETEVADFKEITGYNLDMVGKLDELAPGSEYKHTTLVESKEKYKVKTYAKAIAFTRQMMVNDDMKALVDISKKFGRAGAITELELFWAFFQGSHLMGDGVELFDNTAHKNVGTNTGINNDALTKLFNLIEAQKDAGGNLIHAVGGYVLAPLEYKVSVEALLANIAATKAADVNVHAGKYKCISSPLLTTGKLIGAAKKGTADLVEVAYIQGQKGVYIEENVDFKTDGVHIKGRLDVGMKPKNFRSFSKLTIS